LKVHRIRGSLIVIVASLALGLLMFLPRLLNGGIALGFGLLIILLLGVLDWMGRLHIVASREPGTKSSPVDTADSPPWLKLLAGFNIRMLYLGFALLTAAACRVSVIGTLGASATWSGPALLILGLLTIIAAKFLRHSFDGNLHQGFLVFVMATATIMATLGSHGLWDCWETHYGEVARRQLEQDDWISLFWESKWFYSKPILIFWMMNLGMALFGVRISPDHISSHAEWGIRFFVGALSIAVIFGVYSVIARRVSKRAGMFTALVLATMPMFTFMARQATTDLPFVGFMALAVVLFLLGITVAPDAEAQPRELPIWRGRRLSLSGFHAVIAGYLIVGVPQFLYLATRSAGFVFGTLGRSDLRTTRAQHEFTEVHLSTFFDELFGMSLGGSFDLALDWVLLGMMFGLPFAFIIFTLRKERRISRLCFHGMYLLLALSVMAKGLPGLVLPILGLFGLWFVIVPWSDLKRPKQFVMWHLDKAKRLDLLRGIPMFLLTAAPWYLAMIIRHGDAFITRFFIHDHIKRLSVGVHGETGTFQYMMQQFGYAAFPWVALLPFAMLAWPAIMKRQSDAPPETPEEKSSRIIRLFATSWALLSFMLFSMMVTKFHHYTFPLTIPVAILIGLFIDDIWQKRVPKMGAVVLTAVVILITIGKDLVAQPDKARGVFKGYAQLVGLFIYKYKRPYPDGAAWDFHLPLLIFTVIFVVLILGWLLAKHRRIMLVATLLAMFAFGHWVAQHYMIQLAPHWTQKHLIEEYYARRKSSSERLVAFQMNWKGENFYTGNRVKVYVSTKNKDFENWLKKHRGQRHFFITEHSRFKKMSKRAKAASGEMKPFADTCNKYRAGWADKL
jgi:4-amino-4-deoxy-L-arabinose transferase-like glycosyltransferase